MPQNLTFMSTYHSLLMGRTEVQENTYVLRNTGLTLVIGENTVYITDKCPLTIPAPRIVQETKLGLVPLVAPRHGYRQLGHDDIVHMLITQASIFPNSKLFVPVFVQLPPDETPEDELVAIKIKYVVQGSCDSHCRYVMFLIGSTVPVPMTQ